jgi:hypothetical protein
LTDQATLLLEEFVACVGIAPDDPPGGLLGVEQEFTVRTRAGWPVDFGELLPDLTVGRDALDPSLPGARRWRSGAVLSADGREAEVAAPPVAVRPGFAAETTAWGHAARRDLAKLLPESYALSGYSTHFSVSVDDARNPPIGGLYTRTFALGLMLLVDRATSPGLIVRPRPRRLELCGEFVDGAHLHAAAAYAVGSALACHRAITGERALAWLPPQLQVRTRPAVTRAGWFVDRAAFGSDVLADGRSTRVRRCDGRRIRAQDHLEIAWHIARAELVNRVDGDDLVIADAVVDGTLALPSEDEPHDHGLIERAREPETSAMGRAAAPRIRPSFWVLATASTWNVTVFRIGSRVSARDAYAAIPRAQLGRFLDLVDRGDLDHVVTRYLAMPRTGRVVSATGAAPSIGDLPPTTAAVTERERDAALVARLPGSDLRRRKSGGGIAPGITTVGAAAVAVRIADGRDAAPARELVTARRGCLVPIGRWIAVAVVAFLVIIVVAFALLSGGGGGEAGGPKPAKPGCGSDATGAQISFRVLLVSCAYTADQLTGARLPYGYARMPFTDATIDVAAPSSQRVFGPPCAVHDATDEELRAAKDPNNPVFVALSFIGVPVVGLPPGTVFEVTLRDSVGAFHTGRGVADARGYAEARVPINRPETHTIVEARYFPNGDLQKKPVDVPSKDISATSTIDGSLPGSRCDRDALLARAPVSANATSLGRAVIRNSASLFAIVDALARPGAALDLRGPWTVNGSSDGVVVQGGDLAFPFGGVTSRSPRERAGIAPVAVVHHGGTTVGPSGDGAGTAWQRALPCGAGQLALTVCPTGRRTLAPGNYAAVAAVFAVPVPLTPTADVRYSFTVGGQRYDLAFDAKSHSIMGWSLGGTDPRVRAFIRNNVAMLLVPSDVAGDGTYRIETSSGDRHDVQPPADQPPAPSSGTVPVAAASGKAAPETLAEFVVALGRALQNHDSAFLRARLHPAVIERYGSAACDAYAAGPRTPIEFTVESATAPVVYTWTTDGLTRDVPGTNSVDVTSVAEGQSQPATIHVAYVDGTWRWFTDCGDPLPGAI